MKATKRRKVEPGLIRRVPIGPNIAPGIRIDDRRTVIDAKKVAVLFRGKEIPLADVLKELAKKKVNHAE